MWKYKASSYPKTAPNIETWLNMMGADGWEHYSNYGGIFLFKKQEFGYAIATLDNELVHHGISGAPPPSLGNSYVVKDDVVK